MKNIFLLPTDKPSRLIKNNHNQLLLTIQTLPLDRELGCFPQNIYITSDEEIKVGDWTLMFDDFGNLFLCDKPQQYLGIEKGHHLNKGLRKIILTTDPELIADGVQAIDDEFLEWFVKNPSCEEVKIEDYGTLYNFRYLILIPQEEPKQEIELIDGFIPTSFFNKQETLEEAAEKMYKQSYDEFGEPTWDEGKLFHRKAGFIDGAKWQAERSYSEEEVGELVYTIIGQYANKVNIMIDGSIIDGLFEQFKKKA
jgi:hypothetical protein